ncbi:MAG TPA: MOSC N-terminal beta barrel domain-containing protein [Rhodopila sp.]|uniref:MOSC domain-containing protein n=1 Tax=Rhodopila sp. TaxID=2480087 RepID=UPI002C0A1ADA|nr:MOSC N-terminal beta barrel domain-containing protein [Rhodopila sp.]HVY17513.1 MOSC N-terminal beta barrel domain-containing protein [Rhodopila sp.]
MRIEYLYRYPVKGLTAEALEQTEVEEGGAIPWDRAFALAQGDAGFDPANPGFLPKWNFMCQMKNARAALLFSVFDPKARRLTIRAPDGATVEANPLTEMGQTEIGAFLTDYLGEEARGQPRFHHVPGHVFCDQKRPVVSLNNLASLRDFESKVGGRRHRRRFRANVWFSGAPAWAEREWIGRELQVGGAVLRVLKGTTRCPATEVNPVTGERDADPVRELRQHYGHVELGIHAEVVQGGRFAMGDAIELL